MSPDRQTPIDVLIVDDHELTRFSLKLLLGRHEEFRVVGLASNGLEALQLVKQSSPPNVILLDLQMPVMDGLTAAAKIKQISPETQIIGYTSLEDPQTEVMAQTAPIDVFCKKDISMEALVKLIKETWWQSPQCQPLVS